MIRVEKMKRSKCAKLLRKVSVKLINGTDDNYKEGSNLLKLLVKVKARKVKECILLLISSQGFPSVVLDLKERDAQNCHLCTKLDKACEKKNLGSVKIMLDKLLIK